MSLIRNDIAIEQGHYRVRDVRRGSDVEEGKYLHVWRNRGQRLEALSGDVQHRHGHADDSVRRTGDRTSDGAG